ncbi:hypothetical protein RND71_038410 [Anisodus tanguticus]|uniref:Thioredoxin domain-containing protein n=1 Tax=Anisodus tanguticus TaxID=243964 RepID=A0AAE1UZ50_9SOLA|nr:hypothetical protein RND71_038410 [Anisodus tanguticus]
MGSRKHKPFGLKQQSPPTYNTQRKKELNIDRSLVRSLFPCIKSHSASDGDDSAHNVEFAGGNVCLITTKESWDQKLAEANKEGKIVIANFSASWCGPCRMIAPFYCELSEKYLSLMFLTVDVDELTEFSSSWDIKATPTFFFLKEGEQIDKLVGANKPELQKKITAIADTQVACQTQPQ